MAEMAGEKQNIIQAIATYGKQLFSFIRHRVRTDEDAEDILQDVWFQFSNQPEVTAIGNVGAWLYRVARNKIIDNFRKKKSESIEDYAYKGEDGELQLPEILLANDDTPETEHIRQIFWEQLFAALDELPEVQREAFVLNELEDRTLQQIADRQQVNLKTVISRKRYAVQHLRNRLDALYDDIVNF